MTQMLGAGANVGFGGYMATQCGPHSYLPCMIAAQSLVQAMSLFGNSSGSKDAGAAMAGSGTGTGLTYGASTDGLSGIYGDGTGSSTGTASTKGGALSAAAIGSQISALKADLAKTGTTVSADGKTISLPDGRQVPAGTGSSAGDLASAGFSQSEIDSGMAAVKIGQSKFGDKIQAMKVSEGGGGDGGGGGGKSAGASQELDLAAMMRKMNGTKSGKKASVAGMSKKFGSDNIGVAGDDIFEMITRRYKARENGNAFLK